MDVMIFQKKRETKQSALTMVVSFGILWDSSLVILLVPTGLSRSNAPLVVVDLDRPPIYIHGVVVALPRHHG